MDWQLNASQEVLLQLITAAPRAGRMTFSHPAIYSAQQVTLLTTSRGSPLHGGGEQHSNSYTTQKSSSAGMSTHWATCGVRGNPKDIAHTEDRGRSAFIVSTGPSWPELHPAGKAGRWSQRSHLVLQAKDHIHSLPSRSRWGSEVSQMPAAHS